MAEQPEPEQIALMKRVVELAEQQTTLAAKRTEQSAERSEQSAERSYMNAERTLSVWTRTALSLMIFGIAVDRFGLLLRHEPWPHAGSPLLPNPLSTLGGVILVALGVFMVGTCGVRYLLYARAWRKVHAWPPRHAPYLAFTFAVLVALFGIALLVVLLVFAGK
ncbi:MAG: YidH family protein [Rhodanobacteraceae bacterium]